MPHFEDVDLSVEDIKSKLRMLSHMLHVTPLRSLIKTLDNVERFVFRNQRRINSTLSNLSIPTLLIAGELDDIVPVKYSKMIRKLVKRAELKIIKKGHHRVIINKAGEINHIIYSFLQKCKLKSV